MDIEEKLKNLIVDDEGATMVEYAIMVAAIAAVCVTAVSILGSHVLDLFTSVPNF